jgi:hypothetical protein
MALVGTDVSEDRMASIISVTRIGELRRTLAVTSNRSKLRTNMKMVSSGLVRRVALVRTDVSEVLSASFLRETKIGELGTTQAATSNRRTLFLVHRFLSP